MATMTIDQYIVRLVFSTGETETLEDPETGAVATFASEADAQNAAEAYVTSEDLSIRPDFRVEWDELRTWQARYEAMAEQRNADQEQAFQERQRLLGAMGTFVRGLVESARTLAADLDLDVQGPIDLASLRSSVDECRSMIEGAVSYAQKAEEQAGEAYDAADRAKDEAESAQSYAGEAQSAAEEAQSQLGYAESSVDELDNLLSQYGA